MNGNKTSVRGSAGCGFWIALLVLAGFGAGAREPEGGRERDWFKLLSPNFQLYGNGRQSEARKLLRELETFRHVVSRFLGLTNVQRRPALVYFFKDEDSFAPFKPRYNDQPATISGFHSEDPLDYVLAFSRQSRDSATMRVLFHEYTHLLTSRQFRDAPLWVHEGVAEVFSTFEERDDRFDIGVAMTNHAFFLQRHAPLPVRTLLGVTRDSKDYNERARAGPFYASSWLLAHHLLFARRGFESNVVARYAAACSSTTNQFLAFQSGFDVSALSLDEALRDYVRGGSYTVVRQTYPDLDIERAQPSPMSPGEWDYALGRLLQMSQQNDAAKVRLQAAAGRAPKDPRPLEALSLLAWREGDRANLRSLSDRALANNSQSAFLHFLSAESVYESLLQRRSQSGAAFDPADLQTGRQRCERAIELDPWLAPAHHLLAVYSLAENPRAPALAAVHVQRALRCDPLFKPALLTSASLAAAQGNFGLARRILASLLAGPLPSDLRRAAGQVAAEIDRQTGSPKR
ncbi:MAG: tetratricopeptide repeat protein [Limisphaerales bacterium]